MWVLIIFFFLTLYLAISDTHVLYEQGLQQLCRSKDLTPPYSGYMKLANSIEWVYGINLQNFVIFTLCINMNNIRNILCILKDHN